MRREIRTRRGILALTGGTLAALAGCVSDSSDDESDDSGGDSDSGDSSDNDEPRSEEATDTVDVPGGGYYQFSIEPDTEATLEWSVQNELDTSNDFDVFLFTQSEFEIYDEMINGDSRRPEYISEGTAQGIEQSTTRTVTLSEGNYRLVVDNSDYGDAGDFGQEDTRRVTMTREIREA